MKRYLVLLPAAFALAGCLRGAAVTPYDSQAIWHLQAGRDFAAQGRYELAKEQYLMALAANNEPQARTVITRELKSIDMIIQTQR